MEYEVRYYYSSKEYDNFVNLLSSIKDLKKHDKRYEKTIQYNHPSKEYDFYSDKVDGRFRIRKTKDKNFETVMISFKKRLNNTFSSDVNCEEEVELTIKPIEYDNLIYIIEKVLHMKLVESYERYRIVFDNQYVTISLDLYPFGLALEIECNKEYNEDADKIINKYTSVLNLDKNNKYRLSWDDKYEELCREQSKEIYKDVSFDKDMPNIK